MQRNEDELDGLFDFVRSQEDEPVMRTPSPIYVEVPVPYPVHPSPASSIIKPLIKSPQLPMPFPSPLLPPSMHSSIVMRDKPPARSPSGMTAPIITSAQGSATATPSSTMEAKVVARYSIDHSRCFVYSDVSESVAPHDILLLRGHPLPFPFLDSVSLSFVVHLPASAYFTILRSAAQKAEMLTDSDFDITPTTLRSLLRHRHAHHTCSPRASDLLRLP